MTALASSTALTRDAFIAALEERKSIEREANTLNGTKLTTFDRIAKDVANDTVAAIFTTYNVDLSYIVSRKRSTAMRNIYMLKRSTELASFLAGNFKINHFLLHIALTMFNFKKAGIDTATMQDLRASGTLNKSEATDKSRDKLVSRYQSTTDSSTLNTQTPISIQSFEVFNILEATRDAKGEVVYRFCDNEHFRRFEARMKDVFNV